MPQSVPAKHGPARYASYVEIQKSVIGQLIGQGFVAFDETKFTFLTREMVLLFGHLGCSGGIVVGVEKYLQVSGELDGSPLVQTSQYSYNVWLQGGYNLLRYDNSHVHPGHPDKHHKHEFDWRTGAELSHSPICIGAAAWPTLGEVLHETRDWYYANAMLLPPDAPSLSNLRI